MKRLIILTGIIIYGLFAVSSFVGVATEENGGSMPISQPTQVIGESKKKTGKYILTVADGVIVVKNCGGEIVKNTDTRVAILPKQDRKKLYQGIEVSSEKELDRLLEDFCS